MERRRRQLVVAVLAAVLAAEASVLLLRPRDGVLDPVPVEASSYFDRAQLDRARDYRRPQFALSIAVMVVQGGVLVALVARPPARLTRTHRRPVLAAAVAGAALSATLSLAPLPLQLVARERALDAGLITQGWDGYALDRVKAMGIDGVIYGGAAALAILAMRRMERRWWVAGAAIVVTLGSAMTYLQPVVLDPLFNDFEELPAGRARDDVLALAQRAGVGVGRVEVIDASRRTTAANAYVAGLGATKRVVLYDTLVEEFPPEELRLVVAHELAHVRYDDLRNGLLYLLLVAPAGVLLVQRLTEWWTPEDRRGTAAGLPALALALGVVTLLVTVTSNQLSRRVEARADAYALSLTGEPDAFIRFEQRITRRNLTDPDPPVWTRWRATHPTIVQRIGFGERAKQQQAREP